MDKPLYPLARVLAAHTGTTAEAALKSLEGLRPEQLLALVENEGIKQLLSIVLLDCYRDELREVTP